MMPNSEYWLAPEYWLYEIEDEPQDAENDEVGDYEF
jgi:hypothetical protein